MEKTETRMLDIRKIQLLDKAIRKHLPTDENIIQLANDIKSRGMLSMPTVTPREDYYILTDGARRFAALQLLLSQGDIVPEMQFQVTTKNLTDDEIIGYQIAGNHHIVKMANRAVINGLYNMAISGSKTTDEVAKMAGISHEYMMKLFKTLKLDEKTFKLCEEKGVQIGHLIILSDLVDKIPEDDFPEWIDKAKTLTAKDFTIKVAEELNIIKEALGKNREGKKTNEFKTEPVLLSKEQLLNNYRQADTTFTIDPSRDNEVILSVYKTIWQMDEETIAKKRVAFEQALAEKARKMAERKEKKAQLDINEMQKILQEKGFKIEAPNGNN